MLGCTLGCHEGICINKFLKVGFEDVVNDAYEVGRSINEPEGHGHPPENTNLVLKASFQM
jgi:hypothetical protein